MLTIGLTGGIGSGKSTIARVINTLGYPVYISDRRASALMDHNEPLREALIRQFGSDIYLPSGPLDRQRLASIVFHDKTALTRVNQIVHPAVLADFEAWGREQHADLLFFESAILFEAHLNTRFDAIIVVTADLETRLGRVMGRDRTSREKVLDRVRNQMPDEEKCLLADYVICNNDRDRLLPQVLHIIEQVKTHASYGKIR